VLKRISISEMGPAEQRAHMPTVELSAMHPANTHQIIQMPENQGYNLGLIDTVRVTLDNLVQLEWSATSDGATSKESYAEECFPGCLCLKLVQQLRNVNHLPISCSLGCLLQHVCESYHLHNGDGGRLQYKLEM
jgi:hypothetical protein